MHTLTTVIRSQFTKGLVEAIGSTKEFDELIRELGQIAAQVGRNFVTFTKFLVEHRNAIAAIVGSYGTFRISTAGLIRNITKLIGASTGLGSCRIDCCVHYARDSTRGIAGCRWSVIHIHPTTR